MSKKHIAKPLLSNPIEPYPGLTVSDLNRYLPALQKVDDINMTIDSMHDGVFLTDGLEGLRKLPSSSIDIIITDPPENPWRGKDRPGSPMTLQEYYKWNNNWLEQAHRVLKSTGALYLFCDWRLSGMYHSMLTNFLHVQTRITWRKMLAGETSKSVTWNNQTADIWFATKTNDFLFHQDIISDQKDINSSLENLSGSSNLWADIINSHRGKSENLNDDKPEALIKRILDASSFKLNWVVDPFMGSGGIGVVTKKLGRRFIGFETDQDQLLISMKRIDQS